MSRNDAQAWRRYLRFWGADVRDDVDEELRFHLAMRADEYASAGIPRAEARRRAEDRFGSVDAARRECMSIDKQFTRKQGRLDMLRSVLQDLRFAQRVLRRQALPALAAIACLAVGVSATTAMFSVTDRMLLRPLPYPTGDRLVTINSARGTGTSGGGPSSYLDYLDWSAAQHSFTSLTAVNRTDFIMLRGDASRVPSALVSGNFFTTFGISAEAGRAFGPADDKPGASPVIVVSDAFARREFGDASQAVGKTVDFNAAVRTIVGVIPDKWRFPASTDVWLPIASGGYAYADRAPGSRGERNLEVFGLLRPGMTVTAAQQDLRLVAARLARDYPRDDAVITPVVVPLRERYVGNARGALNVMIGAALAVLLVACANLAALQLARSAARGDEIAVRGALGAPRGRIIRQLLTESILLALVGGAVGALLATWTRGLVGRAVVPNAPAWMTFDLDARVLGFALALSCLTGIAFGIAPALRLTASRGWASRRGATAGRSRARLQRAFIVVELAASIALVVAAMLALDSAGRLQRVPLGFDPGHVLTFRVALQGPAYDSASAKIAFVQSVNERLAALPGATSSGAVDLPPVEGCCSRYTLHIVGTQEDAGHDPQITGTIVTPGYFNVLRLHVRAGRALSAGDDGHAPLALVVNRSFAERYWPAGRAVGQRVELGSDTASVVGVVDDIRQEGLLDQATPQFFMNYAQLQRTFMTFMVRTRGDASALAPEVRRLVRSVDAGIPVYEVQPLQDVVNDATMQSRGFGRLLTIFAGVALLLAAMGLYGVVAFLVAARTRELGVRIALGADPASAAGLVVRQSAVLTCVGAAAGLVVAVFVARWLSATLYGVRWMEPHVYIGATAALVGIAFLATWAPARRAARTDPVAALRAD